MTRRITILDVAADAEVSISSVSAALNDRPGVSTETRQRITESARRLGWVPSVRGRSLSSKRAYAVGLVIERAPEVIESDPFFSGFIAGIESVLQSSGYALVLQIATHADGLERYRRLALDHRVDGVFLTDMSVNDARVELVERLGMPAIAVNSARDCPVPSVRQDFEPGFVDLVRTVTSLGHRRIAHVAGRRGMIHTRQRLALWRSTLTAAGVEPGPVVYGDFSTASGSRAADRLLGGDAPRPSAVVCANDLMAIGFIARASALGYEVPRDISVTGFDGIHLGEYVRPSLTTVTTAPRDLGAAAARSLMRLLGGQAVGDVDIAPTTLLCRGSLTEPASSR